MTDDPSTVPAGWFPDPYGRYAQRYWDGARWTQHVATGGVQAVDPMGSSPVIPVATPATQWQPPASDAAATGAGGSPTPAATPPATSPAPAAAGTAVLRLLDAMGPEARDRPQPSLTTALAGIGGAVIAFGAVLIAGGDDGNRAAIAVVAAVVVALAWALRSFVAAPHLRAAGTGAGAVGIGFFAFAVTISDEGDGSTWTALLLAALYLAGWALPGFRGRTLFLGLGATALIATFGSLTAPDLTSEFDDSLPLGNSITSVVGDQGIILLIGAAVCLALTWWLDRRGYRSTATGLVAAGLVAALGGTVLLAQRFSGSGAAFLVLVVGVLVCLVGSHGGRRATTWAGAALTAGGLVALIGLSVNPNGTTSTGTVLVVAGALLVIATAVAAGIRAARDADAPPPT